MDSEGMLAVYTRISTYRMLVPWGPLSISAVQNLFTFKVGSLKQSLKGAELN